MTSLLSLDGLTKAYPGVIANDGISFEIAKGEIHALLGENGAGKSTLVKAIYGLVQPDSGHMLWREELYAPNRPGDARKAGIAMVFQHFSLFEALSVTENIALGMDHARAGRDLAREISKVSGRYGLPLDPARLIGDLSVGERQRVEIVRCLLQNPSLLVMDEPTSVLTPQEVEQLFTTLRTLRDEGVSILYISHKLEEIRTLCDHATILRGGKVVATCTPAEETARSMAGMMIGAELAMPQARTHTPGDIVMRMRGLNLPSETPFGTSLSDISLDLRAGQVTGFGGVAGNGQEELLAALSGERTCEPAEITFSGKPIGHLRPNARRRLGICSAPEERLGHAAVPGMSLTENALLTGLDRRHLLRGGFIRWRKAADFTRTVVADFDVRTAGVTSEARSLSGGNLQKFVIGREILQEPKVLIVNQPTWGVDAAAAASIRQALVDLAGRGAAVLVISQDLDELMEIADVFCVLNDGRLSAPQSVGELTVDEIGLLMGGNKTATEVTA